MPANRSWAWGGDDVIQARGGEDWAWGGEGDDMIAGGGGQDQLWGEAGDDVLYGGPGDDRLDGGPGCDRILGGTGDDWIILSSGSDQIDGGEGYDQLDARGLGELLSASIASASNRSPDPALTLSYQVDFVETVVRYKHRPKRLPIASLELSFAAAPRAGDQAQDDPAQDDPAPQSHQQLKSIAAILAPSGVANLIDFSFQIIPSGFEGSALIQAPAIALDLAAGTLAYTDSSGEQLIQVQGFHHGIGSPRDDQIIGDDQDNRLFGGQGRDCLDGGSGDDWLISNGGDRLVGGAGADGFQLNGAWQRQICRDRAVVRDIDPVTIVDFGLGDRIYLENERSSTVAIAVNQSMQYLPFADLADGCLSEAQFRCLDGGGALGAGRPRQQAEARAALELDESVRLIYDSSSGELFYRGPHLFGGLDHWSKVAVLEGAPSLGAADFWVL